MKIISKFKDFYDYKVAKYGVDEKLVYIRKTYAEYVKGLVGHTDLSDRISEENFNKDLDENVIFFNENNCHKILFAGEKLVHLFFTENRIYTHFDVMYSEDLSRQYKNIWYMLANLKNYSYYMNQKEISFNDGNRFIINSNFNYDWLSLLSYDRKRFFKISSNSLKDSILLNEPMILIEYIGGYNKKERRHSTSVTKFTYNPNLTKLGIYLDEDFIWQSLVEFLSNKRSEKEISPEVSDENKILSKGFDLKSSFRPKMKKKK